MTIRRDAVSGSERAPSTRSSRLKRGVAGAAAVAVVASGLVMVATSASAAVPLSGTVYLDYGGDGAYNAAVDSLVGGVTVTAYKADGTPAGRTKTTVNAVSGAANYSFNADASAGEALRIEFTDLPAGMRDTFNAEQSGVQFMTVAGSGNVVDYGIFDANQYSLIVTGGAANPTLGTAILVAGSRTNADVANEPAVAATKWNVAQNASTSTANTAVDFAQRTTWATYSEVGSVFSLANDSVTGSVYAGATYKRISDLGPQGLGGIYRIANAVDANGNPVAGVDPVGFDVTTLGIDVGQYTAGAPDAAARIVDQSTRALAEPNKLLADIDPFQKAMKVGIGGIAIDADARILYFVNLFDKKVYALSIVDPTNPKLIGSIDTPATADNGKRVFAVTVQGGQLYVGYNDTGESAAWRSASAAGLQYDVSRTPVLAPGASSWTGAWEGVLSGGSLGYAKGNPASGWGGGSGGAAAYATAYPSIVRWNTWTDQWGDRSTAAASAGQTVGIDDTLNPNRGGRSWGGYTQVYPQPMLTGLTFDREGYLTLGFADRTGFQGGNRNWAAYTTPTQTNDVSAVWETLSSGDTLIAAPVRSADNTRIATWTPESDGKAGTRTAAVGAAGQGPGGKEFYDDQQHTPGTNHSENTLGGVVIVPGTTELVATAYDSLAPIRVAGLQWFSAIDGSRTRGYQHTRDLGDPNATVQRTSFQKGGGMGGLTLLGKAAPVEIGNRTWLDLDGDGIQDAGEPSIVGATATLYRADASGNPAELIESKQTDANGNYFFRSQNAATGGTPGFTADGDYVVVFSAGSGSPTLNWHGQPVPAGFSTPTWSQLEFTTPTADDTTSLTTTRDSNANPATGNAAVAVGTYGQNDHTIDAGWRMGTVRIGDRVWVDTDADGVQDKDDTGAYTEPGIANVLMKVYRGDTEVTTDAFGKPLPATRTDANGAYLFENLPVLPAGGSYEVRIVKDDLGTKSALLPYTPTKTGAGDRGSDSSSWIAATEGLYTPGSEDLTLDFGFVLKTYALGDKVWVDRNKNGRQDAGEAPLGGVTVKLLDRAGNPVKGVDGLAVTTTTDPNGRYFFDELLAGDFIVEFVLPAGYHFTAQDAPAANDINDSDADTTTGRTGVITLGNGSVNPNYTDQTGWVASEGLDPRWDAGVVPDSVSVGDFVWFDANKDGLQGTDESGIPGVTLTLTGPNGQSVKNVYGEAVGPQVTDGEGHYEFADLPVLKGLEVYTVTISNVPSKYTPTTPGVGADRAKDSSTDSAASRPLTTDGANDPTLDFGFVLKTPGADINKSDANGNDANTTSEAADLGPTGGSTEIVFTITNNGAEPITNIGLVDATTAGSGQVAYPIVLDLPGGGTYELADAAARWNGTLAVDAKIVAHAQLSGVAAGAPHTDVVTLWAEGALTGKPVVDPANPGTPEKPNRPSDPYNAVVKTYAIGDVVWVDRNKNGQQDAGEAPIKDVTVKLLDATGAVVATTTTDAAGRYLFDALTAGNYQVEFVRPDGYTFTTQNAVGVSAGANSDADASTGRTGVITLGNASVTKDYLDQKFTATEGIDPTWDAGVVPESVSVGDFVWFDANNDGIQGAVEPGIEGVTLTLTGPGGKPVTNVYGEPVNPVATNGAGRYEFIDLPVLSNGESYTVTVSKVPEKYTPTTPGAGVDRAKDSSTGSASSGPLTTDGANDPTLDFGFVLKTPGAVVNKSDERGNDANHATAPVDLSATDGATGLIFTITNNGAEPMTNIGLSDATTVGSGQVVYPIVLALPGGGTYSLAQADSRWRGQLAVGATITAKAQLVGVVAGQPHTDVVTLWADGALTGQPVQDPANPGTPEKPNRPSDPYNAVVKTYAIGDFVWVDSNKNGQQDADEAPIKGVTVTLLDKDGAQVATVATDAKGYYQFDELKPGQYQVVFALPYGYVFTASNTGSDASDSDAVPDSATSATGRTVLVTLDDTNTNLVARAGVKATEGIDPTWDAGVRPAEVTVGDYVWKDTDRDGIQDAGEPGIPGVVLVVERSDGKPVTDVNGKPVAPVTTDVDGKYLFDHLPLLPEGVSYVVKIDRAASVDALKGLAPTVPNVGRDTGADSSTWQETATGLKADGDKDLTLDFGFVTPSVTVGDRVWEDSDHDGTQDSGEPGIPGVVLVITGPDGKPVTDVYGKPVKPVTTDENGNYLFPNLPALPEGKSYTVTVDRDASSEALKGFTPTIPGQGDRATDSSTWTATTQGLNEGGEKDLTLDFGFIRPAVSVGDFVWIDKNRDGRQDSDEPGVPGVVLVITGPDGKPVVDVFGKPVGPQITDGSGAYLFVNLPVLEQGKSYTVSIDKDASAVALKGLVPTVAGKGDRAGDSSDWTASTEGLTADGEKDPTLDFGFVTPRVTVGDRVWLDSNANGRQDAGEPGLRGVVLVITGPDGKPVTDVFGNPVGSVTTDGQGNYLFENLPALAEGESYQVAIDRTASSDALKGLLPTASGKGERGGDSSTWWEFSKGLTADGDQDLTLDFGFVLPVGVTPPPSLPNTGGSVPLLPLGAAGLLLLLGGALILGSRRRRQEA